MNVLPNQQSTLGLAEDSRTIDPVLGVVNTHCLFTPTTLFVPSSEVIHLQRHLKRPCYCKVFFICVSEKNKGLYGDNLPKNKDLSSSEIKEISHIVKMG